MTEITPETLPDMPKVGLYGRLGEIALTLKEPLGASICALASLYAGQLINRHDPRPKPRPVQWTVIVGKYGSGKTRVIEKAQEAMFIPYDDASIVTNTLSSDRGFIDACREGLDKKEQPKDLRGVCIHADEMLGQLKKMAIDGSTLMQTMNKAWNVDRFGATDVKGAATALARTSLLGGLTMKAPEDFPTIFAASSRGGFIDRLVLAPVYKQPKVKRNWKPSPYRGVEISGYFDDETEPRYEWSTAPLRPKTHPANGEPCDVVFFPEERYNELEAWEEAHIENGATLDRVPDLVNAYAIILSSANGDRLVTAECMKAALVFGDWQLKIRSILRPGEGEDELGILKNSLMDKMRVCHQAELDGKPVMCGTRSVTKGKGIVKATFVKKFNLHKHGKLAQAWGDLIKMGTIDEVKTVEGSGADKKVVATGNYFLTDFEWPKAPANITAMPTQAADFGSAA